MTAKELSWVVAIDVAPEILSDVLARQLARPDVTIRRGEVCELERYDVRITSRGPSASRPGSVLELRVPPGSRVHRRRRVVEQVIEVDVHDVDTVRLLLEELCPHRIASRI
jgi:hypothetical protein